MTQEALKKMYQLLLTEPHAPTVCAQLERIAREALAEHSMREVQRLGQEIEQEPVAWMSEHDVGFRKSEFGATPTVPLYTAPPQRTEQNPVMMEIFWGGDEAGVKLTQGFIDSHKVLQLDVLIDAKAEIERIYEELLGAKE